MENTLRYTKLNHTTRIVAKTCEIIFWLGEAICILAFIILIIAKEKIGDLLQTGLDGGEMTITGFSINLFDSDGTLIMPAIVLLFIDGIISAGLTAMIFRNIYLILKKERPFCSNNVRMVREIGIFAISQPIVGIILSIIGSLIVSADELDIAVNVSGIVFGIAMLCLSQYFAYGAELEKDVEGLV